jgi:hypothetical protein
MMPITTSEACARLAIGASAAAAVAQNTLRRVMVMTKSLVFPILSMKRLSVTVKPQ